MAQFDDVKALIAALDAETTRIAAKLQELLDRLAAGGQTPEQEAEIFADLQALKARLDALGRDPEEPIPSA